MKIFEYMFPNEVELKIIIAIIYAFAFFVLWRCHKMHAKAQENLALLDESNPNNIVDISKLKDYFDDPKIAAEDKTFNGFANLYGKNDNTEALFDHINTMWTAKSRGKSFDTEILVDKTIEKIFAGTDTIKAMISLFLVCGILGTLFGLAISMENFDPTQFISNNTGNAQQFSELFKKLKSAFAPSINGVIATIVFVLGYTYFIQEKCINALNQRLAVITIKKWIPVLFPSESEESVKEINAAIDKANRITENYEEMDSGLDKVVDKLGEANETVSRVIEASDALHETATAFKDGAGVIGELTASVQTLSTQSSELNTAVKEVVNRAVTNAANLQQNSIVILSESVKKIVNDNQSTLQAQVNELRENFALQKDQLQQVINSLKLYDHHFAESNTKIQDGLVQSCQNITEAVGNLKNIQTIIDEKDRKVMAAVGQPLTQQLQNLAQSIANQLSQITVKIGSLQDPMSESAKTIQTMYSNMARHNEAIAAKLAASGMTKEQIEAITKQIPQNITVDNSVLESKLDTVITTIETVSQTIREANTKNSITRTPAFNQTESLENKLDDVVEQLRKMNRSATGNIGASELKVKKLLPLAIVILLFFGVVLQGTMVWKIFDMHNHIDDMEILISELQENQAQVNKITLDKQTKE